MKILTTQAPSFKGGEAHKITIQIPETQEDLTQFFQWLHKNKHYPMGCDTETTGLDVWSPGFKVRTVQLALQNTAWIITEQVTNDFKFLKDLHLFFHNAMYDVLALGNGCGVWLNYGNLRDTRILAHLVDPREEGEGGPGLSLESLTRFYIDESTADEIKASMTKLARELKIKKGDLFKTIDVTNETYLLYAGMDAILTYRLGYLLSNRVLPSAKPLIEYEHNLAEICMQISQKGFLLDTEYTQQFADQLLADQEYWEAVAYNEYGCESVNSTAEVAEILIEEGVKLTERTSTGKYKVTDDILKPLAEEGNLLATCVLEAKKAKKWLKTWVQTFLDEADPNNRCHAWINPLKARTGRMSITGIPAQTLPSGDWRVRRCFIPDENEAIVSCDYQAQELRVLAALSGDQNMQAAFKHGEDLHQKTADASGVERSVGKTVNFAYVYGSGPANIAKTCNISVEKAKEVIKGFETTYPGVKQLNKKLQDIAKKQGFITTPFGRILPVDPARPYSALNYMIQSTSRDITARAMLRLAEAGLTPYLRLPIHDEVVASVPADRAEECAKIIADIMQDTLHGVKIETDAAVYGPSWGHGYM